MKYFFSLIIGTLFVCLSLISGQSKYFKSEITVGAAAAIAGASALLSGGLNSISSKKQYNYQRKLNEQQQEFTEKNMYSADKYQRSLTQDSAYLNKLGLQKAGLSTANISDGSLTAQNSNASMNSSSGGSAPNPNLGSSLDVGLQAFNTLYAINQQQEQNKLLAVKRESQELENDFARQTLMARIRGTLSKYDGYRIDNDIKTFSYRLLKKYGERKTSADTRSSENQANISDVASKYAEQKAVNDIEQQEKAIDLQIQELENKKKQGSLTDAQIASVNEEIKNKKVERDNLRKIGRQIDANTSNIQADTEGKRISNEIARDTKEAAKEIIENRAFEGLMRNVPTDISSSIRYTIARKQRGESVSSAEWQQAEKAFQWLKENQYRLQNANLNSAEIKVMSDLVDFGVTFMSIPK